MITYTTNYSTAELVDSTIVSIYCIVRGEDENGVFETIGEKITFDTPISVSDFSKITKAEVDSWVTVTDQYKELEKKVAIGINNQNAVVVKELPWNVKEEPPPVVNPVPDSVTPLQIRMAINMMGLRDSVNYYVSTLDQSAQDAWEYATIIERTNPILVNGAIALGKTEEDLDNLFILASTLT